jgi:hypothetical protein
MVRIGLTTKLSDGREPPLMLAQTKTRNGSLPFAGAPGSALRQKVKMTDKQWNDYKAAGWSWRDAQIDCEGEADQETVAQVGGDGNDTPLDCE